MPLGDPNLSTLHPQRTHSQSPNSSPGRPFLFFSDNNRIVVIHRILMLYYEFFSYDEFFLSTQKQEQESC